MHLCTDDLLCFYSLKNKNQNEVSVSNTDRVKPTNNVVNIYLKIHNCLYVARTKIDAEHHFHNI
jgi:hypothetical protein